MLPRQRASWAWPRLAMLDLSLNGTPIARRSSCTSPFSVRWNTCSWVWLRKRRPATGLKCPTVSSPVLTDLIQVIWFCSTKNGRSRTISSNGSQGRLLEPDMLRKKDASGRITRAIARATSVIQAR